MEQHEMDIRVRRFYRNIMNSTRCQQCDLGHRGPGTLSLGDMLEHIERTGHAFHFETRSIHSLENQSRMDFKTMNPRLDEFLILQPLYKVIQADPDGVQPVSHSHALRRQLERQGFDASEIQDDDLEKRFEIRLAWRCDDGVSHVVELDQVPENERCPVCKNRMTPVERARRRSPTKGP